MSSSGPIKMEPMKDIGVLIYFPHNQPGPSQVMEQRPMLPPPRPPPIIKRAPAPQTIQNRNMNTLHNDINATLNKPWLKLSLSKNVGTSPYEYVPELYVACNIVPSMSDFARECAKELDEILQRRPSVTPKLKINEADLEPPAPVAPTIVPNPDGVKPFEKVVTKSPLIFPFMKGTDQNINKPPIIRKYKAAPKTAKEALLKAPPKPKPATPRKQVYRAVLTDEERNAELLKMLSDGDPLIVCDGETRIKLQKERRKSSYRKRKVRDIPRILSNAKRRYREEPREIRALFEKYKIKNCYVSMNKVSENDGVSDASKSENISRIQANVDPSKDRIATNETNDIATQEQNVQPSSTPSALSMPELTALVSADVQDCFTNHQQIQTPDVGTITQLEGLKEKLTDVISDLNPTKHSVSIKNIVTGDATSQASNGATVEKLVISAERQSSDSSVVYRTKPSPSSRHSNSPPCQSNPSPTGSYDESKHLSSSKASSPMCHSPKSSIVEPKSQSSSRHSRSPSSSSPGPSNDETKLQSTTTDTTVVTFTELPVDSHVQSKTKCSPSPPISRSPSCSSPGTSNEEPKLQATISAGKIRITAERRSADSPIQYKTKSSPSSRLSRSPSCPGPSSDEAKLQTKATVEKIIISAERKSVDSPVQYRTKTSPSSHHSKSPPYSSPKSGSSPSFHHSNSPPHSDSKSGSSPSSHHSKSPPYSSSKSGSSSSTHHNKSPPHSSSKCGSSSSSHSKSPPHSSSKSGSSPSSHHGKSPPHSSSKSGSSSSSRYSISPPHSSSKPGSSPSSHHSKSPPHSSSKSGPLPSSDQIKNFEPKSSHHNGSPPSSSSSSCNVETKLHQFSRKSQSPPCLSQVTLKESNDPQRPTEIITPQSSKSEPGHDSAVLKVTNKLHNLSDIQSEITSIRSPSSLPSSPQSYLTSSVIKYSRQDGISSPDIIQQSSQMETSENAALREDPCRASSGTKDSHSLKNRGIRRGSSKDDTEMPLPLSELKKEAPSPQAKVEFFNQKENDDFEEPAAKKCKLDIPPETASKEKSQEDQGASALKEATTDPRKTSNYLRDWCNDLDLPVVSFDMYFCHTCNSSMSSWTNWMTHCKDICSR